MHSHIMRRGLTGAVLSMTIAGCGSTSGVYGDHDPSSARHPGGQHFVVDVDGPSYDSVQSLSSQADLIVSVQIGSDIENTTEGQAAGGSPQGLNVQLWSATIQSTQKGMSSASSILIEAVDPTITHDPGLTPGENAIAFLKETPITVDGTPVFSIVGLDQGLVPQVDGKLQPASGSSRLKNSLTNSRAAKRLLAATR